MQLQPMIELALLASAARAQRRTKRSRHRLDRRVRPARNVLKLIELYSARLGKDASDPLLQAAIVRAAELRAVAEDLRSQVLRGESVSADDLVRCERLAAAAERALHLDRRQRDTTPTLQDYLASKVTEAPA
jgi:hypothetical protein